MARKHKPEEIIGKLREAEIALAKGVTVADTCRRIGVSEQSLLSLAQGAGRLEDGSSAAGMPRAGVTSIDTA